MNQDKVTTVEWIESILENHDSPCQFCLQGRQEFIIDHPCPQNGMEEIRVCLTCKNVMDSYEEPLEDEE